MSRRPGPTKKLAPSNAPEHACPHDYREDEGLQLEIDCTECKGPHDLANRQCLSGIMNALVASSSPDAIVLRRYIDKRYRGDAIGVLISCASELASMNRRLASAHVSSDKRCRTCQASMSKVIASARHALLDDPMGYMRAKDATRAEIFEKMVASSGRCADGHQCVAESLAQIGLRLGDD